MANGYLGKISAIVTANTGDFKPKLDAAASDVSKFARTVQSNLTTASSQASKAFEQIWTPLQKLERSLQAAGSMKLSFKGFEGAIKGVDALKSRLADLGKRQIDISVSGTGFKTLQQMREAVGQLTSKDVGFVAGLGGLAQARSLRGAMTGKEQATLDKFSGVQSLAQIQRAIEVIGGKGFDQASLKMRQLVSVSEQLAKPIGAAATQITSLSAEVQTAFGPALLSAQKGVDRLFSDINAGAKIGEERFEGVRRKVEQVTAAVSRMSEANSIASSGKTGRELAFRAPAVSDELMASSSVTNRAANAPLSVRNQRGFADQVSQLATLQGQIASYHAAVERRSVLGLDTSAATARLDAARQSAAQLRESLESTMGVSARSSAAQDNEIALLQRRHQTEKEIEAARLAGVQRAQDNEIALLQRRHQTEKEIEAARLAGVQRAEDNEIALLQRRHQTEKETEAARLAGVQRAEDNEIALLQRRHRAEREIEAARLAGTQRAEDNEITLLQRRERAARDQEAGRLQSQPVPLGGDYFGENLDRRARAMAGGDITAATEQGRSVDRIGQSIAATRGQLDSLPEAMRDRFIPQIQRATDQFANLARLGPTATREQIALATREAERLAAATARAQRASAFAQQFGGPGRRGVEMGMQQVELGGYTAQLQVLQRMLSGVSTTARSQATGAFNALRAAIENAAERGTLGLAGTRRQLQQLTQDAARATAAATGRPEGGVMRDLRRAGDVGRGGFDRFNLAAQQAVFAIDDFFSVTGDASQRLRAMGNNLTQIGFIMGGTAGLVTSLAASLTAQGVVAFIRYANSGREAQDSTKALTDTLEKQKSIVKELADAFRSFASEIASSGFKGASKDAAELSSRLDEIRKKQRERSTERDALLNPDLQRTRATINARERTLADTSDVGRASTIRAEIRDLRLQERAQVRAMQNRPRVSAEGAIDELDASRRRVSEGRVTDIRFAAGGQAGAAPGLLAARREAEANDALAANDRAGIAAAGTDAARMAAARRSVESQLASSRATADRERGMLGTSYAGAAAEKEVARLEDLLNRLNAGIASALDKIEIEVSKQAILAAGRIGSSLEALEQAVGGSAALTLRVNTELTMFAGQLRDAQQNLANAVEAGDTDAAQSAREEIEAIVEATSAHVSAAKSVASFGEALNRVSAQLTNTVLGEAKSDAEQARRKDNAAQAVAGNSDAAVKEAEAMNRRRSRIEANARHAEDREAEIRERREADVRRFEGDARGGRLDVPFLQRQRIRQRDEAQAEIDAARNDGRTVSEDAVRRRDEAQRRLDREFENSEAGRANRDRADEFDRDQTKDRQYEQDVTRGRELMQSPAERAGKELADNLRGLSEAYLDDPNRSRDEYQKDRSRLVQDSMRQQAPAIFNLADSVENAIMQGPSRSALQASDVTTTQGASELNRLLRGDDTAKNQDLVELQKQSSALQELVAIARENGAPPGIFD